MQGLYRMNITIQACELLPHFFTLIRLSKRLFSVTLAVISVSQPRHPLFPKVHYSVLPGLSSDIQYTRDKPFCHYKCIVF